MNTFMYGLGILAFSYISGQLAGEWLGKWMGVNANMGGVGFAMVLLIFARNLLEKRGLLGASFEKGIDFWSHLYVPVIIAMAASLNVRVALTGGLLAILAGIIPTLLAFALLPVLLKKEK